MTIAGLLLAAGKSTRFGRDKLIEPLGDSGIAIQSAQNILPHVDSLTVVTATNNSILSSQLKHLPLTLLSCDQSAQGMAASLVCGVIHNMNCDGWIIALADMPFIQPQTYAQIVTAALQHSIVAPIYSGQRGHPVFIGKKFLPELLQLQGDHGARDILRRHAAEIFLVEVSDAGVVMDIDHPDDLL